MHALSMAIDDQIEGEVGVQKARHEETEVNFNAYKKVSFNGKGLGEVVKAMLVLKMTQGGF